MSANFWTYALLFVAGYVVATMFGAKIAGLIKPDVVTRADYLG